MHATEVRLGNLFLRGGVICEVNSIVEANKGMVTFEAAPYFVTTPHHYPDGYKNINPYASNQPIPISKEWLLMFGFKETEFSDGSKYLEIDKTDYNKYGNPIHINTETWKCYRFQFYKGDWYFGVYKDPKSNQFFVQKKIQFVHKFQNLWFELTDEEIKPTYPSSNKNP